MTPLQLAGVKLLTFKLLFPAAATTTAPALLMAVTAFCMAVLHEPVPSRLRLITLAGLALFGDMVLAMITVTWVTGISSTSSPPGYQLNLALGVLALAAALTGAGRLSIDALIARAFGQGRRV